MEHEIKIKWIEEYLPKLAQEFKLMADQINQNIVPKIRSVMLYNLENLRGIYNILNIDNFWGDYLEAQTFKS